MKFYLIKQLTNTAGQDGSGIAVFDNLASAQVEYHRTLASYHNANDVLFAVVQILNEIGTSIAKEIVDHKPQPEPESEPEQSSIVPE